MRNLTFIFALLFIGWSATASVNSELTTNNYYNYNDSFIFVEGGVEFAVYPNGEFDFYFNPDFRRGNSVHIATPNVNISYNSGYNYDPFIQYDDYGAVIQIESVPIYYDYYGRIIQAGDIFMSYNHFGRLARVGNLHVHYNSHHHITRYTGYINHYNRRYVYRPWHDYYRRPNVNVSIVFGRPYRAYYVPHRVSYEKYVTVYNNYYINNRRQRNFYRPSQKVKTYNYGSRTSSKRQIAYTRTRSNDNIAASRQAAARSKSRSSNIRTQSNGFDRSRSSSVRTYGDKNERSTDSRGRSSRVGTTEQKREVISRDRSARTPQRSTERRIENIQRSSRVERPTAANRERTVQSRSDSRIKSSAPVRENRTIQKSTRGAERKSVSERPTRQRSSSVRTRSTSGSSRSQAIRSKNSSRTRSSARNVNNRI